MNDDAPSRPQTTYDLPIKYKKAVQRLARQLNTSNSQAVQLLIYQGFRTLDEGIWTLDDVQRIRSATNRFRWDLEIPELPNANVETANFEEDYEVDDT